MDMEDFRIYLRRNRAVLVMAGFLVLGSGCAGVVKETGDQLTEDALSPVTVPIREGNKAMDTLREIDAQQKAQNAEMEEIQ